MRKFPFTAMDWSVVMDGFIQQTFDDLDNGVKMCPVLKDPEPDCYCIDMTSMKILYAVKFCMRNFRQCDIFQRVFGEGRA